MSLPTQYQWYLDEDTFGDSGVGGSGIPGLPKLELRIRVPSPGYSLQLTDANGANRAITIPAGDYYLNSVAPGGTVSFCSAFGIAMSLAGVNYTVTIDDDNDQSTGRATITGPAPWTLFWLDPIPRDLLGFTDAGASSTGTIVTSTDHSKFLWLPNLQRQPNEPDPNFGESEDIFGDDAEDIGRPETDYILNMAPSGVSSSTVVSGIRRKFVLTFEPLLGYKMWHANEQIANESFETFWLDCMDNGACPFRYHNWRADDDKYWTQVFDEDNRELKPTCLVMRWVGPLSHWLLELPVRKYVPHLVNGVYE